MCDPALQHMAEPSRAEKSNSSDSTEKQGTANVVKQEKSTFDRRRARQSLPSASTSDRLPSIRQKRDLTLGGVPKRVFTPTIPARRVKKKDNEEPSSATPAPSNTNKKKGKEKQEKKRKDRKKEVVTSASVFSMGPAERLMGRREVDSVRSASLSVVQPARNERQPADRPKVKSEEGNRPLSDGNDDEDEPMDTDATSASKALLFSSSSNPPVVLPLDHTLHKSCKTEGLSSSSKPALKSRDENDEQMDTHPPPTTTLASSSSHSTDAASPADIFSPSKNSKGSFLLLQLPDRLPLPSPPSGDDDSGATKQEDKLCQLQDIPEGLIGKLMVHQSGRVRLALGSTYFDVTMGTRGGFLQQLVSIRANDSTPSLVVLGQLSHRLICTPDLESLTNSDDSLS